MTVAAPWIRVGFFFNHSTIIGGGEISFIDLVDSARSYGVVPVVFVPGGGEVYNRVEERGIRPRRFSLPPIRWYTLPVLPLAVLSIAASLILHRVRVVHINGARCMLLAGTAALLCRIPVVWHVRVVEREARLDRIRAHLSKVIVANSGAVARTLQPIGDFFSKIRIVYNGIELDQFAAAVPVNLQREFGLPPLPVVLAVGRLCVWKRFHVLIEACRILKGNGPAFTCLIIGQDASAEPEYGVKLRAMPVEYGLDNVVFLPWRTDIPSIMKSATLLALPSDGEAFGRVVIEAWACGLPVVSTNAGGPAEIITEGETGLLVPVDAPRALAQKIVLLLSDAPLRDRLTTNGLLRVKDFSLDAHTHGIVKVYRELTKSALPMVNAGR